MTLIEKDTKYSLTPISFRGSRKDKETMAELAERLQCTQSAVVRIALRLLREISTPPFIPELFHRFHVYNVLHSGKNVIHYEPMGEELRDYLEEADDVESDG